MKDLRAKVCGETNIVKTQEISSEKKRKADTNIQISVQLVKLVVFGSRKDLDVRKPEVDVNTKAL